MNMITDALYQVHLQFFSIKNDFTFSDLEDHEYFLLDSGVSVQK